MGNISAKFSFASTNNPSNLNEHFVERKRREEKKNVTWKRNRLKCVSILTTENQPFIDFLFRQWFLYLHRLHDNCFIQHAKLGSIEKKNASIIIIACAAVDKLIS